MKTSSKLANTLLSTSIYNSKIISSSDKNKEKLAKSNFVKIICRTKKSCFLILDIRQAFTSLIQVFTKALIL